MEFMYPQNKVVARLTGEKQVARSVNTTLSTSIRDARLQVTDEDGFGSIIHDLFLDIKTRWNIRGRANATIQTSLGLIEIARIPFQREIPLKGSRY